MSVISSPHLQWMCLLFGCSLHWAEESLCSDPLVALWRYTLVVQKVEKAMSDVPTTDVVSFQPGEGSQAGPHSSTQFEVTLSLDLRQTQQNNESAVQYREKVMLLRLGDQGQDALRKQRALRGFSNQLHKIVTDPNRLRCSPGKKLNNELFS